MALEPSYFFYSDGTITLTNGSDIATGEFVAWDAAVLPFDFVFPQDGTAGMSLIKEVLAPDQIRLAKPWTGSTHTDVPYFMVRWTNHTDPRIYALRVSEYLTRLKAIPENIEEIGQQVSEDAAAVATALTSVVQAIADVDADKQAIEAAAATATQQAGIATTKAREAADSAAAAATFDPSSYFTKTVSDDRFVRKDDPNFGAFSFRNRIINGHPLFNQRGANPIMVGAGYGPDRWMFWHTGSGAPQCGVTDLGPPGFTKSLFINGAAGVTGCTFQQRIESINVVDLAGQTITVSFWSYSTTSDWTPSIELITPATTDNWNGANVKHGLVAGKLSPVNVWTKQSITVIAPAAASRGLVLDIATGPNGAGQNRIITGVQLEKGSVATPFELRMPAIELMLCQRYYQYCRSYIAGAAAGPNITYGLSNRFHVPMRAPPSISSVAAIQWVGAVSSPYIGPMGDSGYLMTFVSNATGGYIFEGAAWATAEL